MDEEYWQVPRQLCYTGRQNDTTEEREYDIMMNPASLMKIMNARNKFVENHPKFAAFLNAVFSAVSYTHLDVYKRQFLHWGLFW